MATTKTQRWGILAILIVTVIGTVGSFAVMILATENQTKDTLAQQKVYADYKQKTYEYQNKLTAQADELSSQYYDIFKSFQSRVAEFDLAGVATLSSEDLIVGDGEEITGNTPFAAYYIGWNPKGKVFDGSIDTEKGKLKAPLFSAVGLDKGLDNASLIQGWKEGMKGMRIGGVREIAIPSDLAYGEKGQGDDIPPNTPIKFVVMMIAAPAVIEQPSIPAELYQNAGNFGG
jgi:FKBP-type peptidyl-prolyl cis-trans isomerase